MAPKPSYWSSCAPWRSPPPAPRPPRVPRPHRKTARSTPSCCRGGHPMPLPATLFGAAFTLATAYALGALLMRKHPAPPEIALGMGAAVESVLVFLLLLFHLAHWGVFLGIGGAAMVAAWRWRGPGAGASAAPPIRIPLAGWVIFGAYGVWYLVNALAPETIADGITYHLGLPNEYLRLGGFPDPRTEEH